MIKAEVAIQQLCSLGLDSQLMMPRLLGLLHGYIPSFANVFFWFDDNGRIRDIYDENPESYTVLPTFLEEYHNKREREVWCGVEASAMYRGALNTEQLWTVDRKTLHMHDFYNDFLKVVGSHWGLHKPIWVDDKPKGLLLIKRTEGEENFSNEDTQKLERISKHIEHAITFQGHRSEIVDDNSVDKGVLIVDSIGSIHHYTNKAERIMMLSQGENKLQNYSQYSFSKLPPKLLSLVGRIRLIHTGQNSLPATETISNQWGEFKFSMYPLKANSEQDSNNLYVIQIEHLEPIRLILFNKIDQYDLTNRQFQICMSIGLGKSYAEIAASLGLMESTIVSHKKEIFRKLGVFNRHELSEKILTP